MLCLAFGCTGNEPNPGSEPEPSEPDYGAFYEKLYSTSLVGVPKESLPDWLIFNLSELENEYSEQPDHILVRIHQGEWKSQIVYFVSKPFNSCLLCDIFYDNGKQIRWTPDDFETVNFCATSKNWAFIYEFGEALDIYDFPIKPGTEEWNQLPSTTARKTALQIPDALLPVISTKGLLETCLQYPFLLSSMQSFYSFQIGFEELMKSFNGFPEFFKRPKLTNVLMEKYENLKGEVESIWSLERYDQINFPFRHFVVEFMLAQDTVVNNLSEEQEKHLILLSLENQKIKQTYSDIFSERFNIMSRYLLYAKILMKDSDFIIEDAEVKEALSEFMQWDRNLKQILIDFLETYIYAKYIEDEKSVFPYQFI